MVMRRQYPYSATAVEAGSEVVTLAPRQVWPDRRPSLSLHEPLGHLIAPPSFAREDRQSCGPRGDEEVTWGTLDGQPSAHTRPRRLPHFQKKLSYRLQSSQSHRSHTHWLSSSSAGPTRQVSRTRREKRGARAVAGDPRTTRDDLAPIAEVWRQTRFPPPSVQSELLEVAPVATCLH